uniref:Striatin-interacting protein 1 homolog n=1 Tax=Rhabditophanes sp. KR3021 TaxID=114890 RepID=A0AC35TVT3_9BILA
MSRPVRPSFADDVYGNGAKQSQDPTPQLTHSESTLAQRRAANLPKLKDFPSTAAASVDNNSGIIQEMCEVDFEYKDCDAHSVEISEFYSYAELNETVDCYNAYVELIQRWNKKDGGNRWRSLSLKEKKAFLSYVIQGLEVTGEETRSDSIKTVLYLLQGAAMDYSEFNIQQFQEDKNFDEEDDVVKEGIRNAYLLYSCGFYGELVNLLSLEATNCLIMNDDLNYERKRCDSRGELHSEYGLGLHSSTNSLERKYKKMQTLANNFIFRVILSCIYHIIESIRREDVLVVMVECGQSQELMADIRADFMEQLSLPMENSKTPLIVFLLNLLPRFVAGQCQYFPIKKIVLTIWKIILCSLGGWKELRADKEEKRIAAGLSVLEDTIEVGSKMGACTTNELNMGNGRDGLKSSHSGRLMSRQFACQLSGSQGSVDEEEALRKAGAFSDAEANKRGFDSISEHDNESSESSEEGQKFTNRSSILFPNYPFSKGDRTPKPSSPIQKEPKHKLMWTPKAKPESVNQFLQEARKKLFGFTLENDDSTTFGLPLPTLNSFKVLKKNVYISLSEEQIKAEDKYNKYPNACKDNFEDTPTERFYKATMPKLAEYVVALLKVMMAALPSQKAKNETVNILSDVLPGSMEGNEHLSNSINLDTSQINSLCEDFLEPSIILAIDIKRHKEIIIKAVSSIIILLLKHMKLNHIYQFEHLSNYLVFANGIPLLLKFLDRNMPRYVQSKNEFVCMGYPQSFVHYAKYQEWPRLTAENMETEEMKLPDFYMWRNLFTAINLVRVVTKLTKGKHNRTSMLVVYKSSASLKRCMKVRQPLFQLYILKLLKMQARYLGRQWRRLNVDLLSSIYLKVRHRFGDDWAFANETRCRSFDYQMSDKDLKANVEKFIHRRYPEIAPKPPSMPKEQSARDGGSENIVIGSLLEYEEDEESANEPIQYDLTEAFKQNYETWLKYEVYRNPVDWNMLLGKE